MIYRQARLEDLPLIIEIEAACFSNVDRFSRKNIKRMLINPKKSVLIDIIIDYQGPIGYAVFLTRSNSKRVRLYSMCILPEYAGKGYANTYLKERLNSFMNGFKEVSLEVRKSNKRAISLYTKLGFIISRNLENYYSDDEHGYLLIKFLDDNN